MLRCGENRKTIDPNLAVIILEPLLETHAILVCLLTDFFGIWKDDIKALKRKSGILVSA